MRAEEKALNSDAKEMRKKIQELMPQERTAASGELMKQVSGRATAAGRKEN